MEPPAREEWGPLIWRLVHLQAISYTDTPTAEDRAKATAFYKSLFEFLPCPECTEHFKEVWKELPIDNCLDNSDALIDWTHAVHNRLNQKLDKPVISKAEFVSAYATRNSKGRRYDPAIAAEKELVFAQANQLHSKAIPGQTATFVPAVNKAIPSLPGKQKLAPPKQPFPKQAPKNASFKAPPPTRGKLAPEARPQPKPKVSSVSRRTLQLPTPKPVGYSAAKNCKNCK